MEDESKWSQSETLRGDPGTTGFDFRHNRFTYLCQVVDVQAECPIVHPMIWIVPISRYSLKIKQRTNETHNNEHTNLLLHDEQTRSTDDTPLDNISLPFRSFHSLQPPWRSV